MLPYPNSTLENLNHSTTTASPLTRIRREPLSELLERAADWSDAHGYSPHAVCTKGHLCARLLHASLSVKAHALLLVSGAEGGAELCSRRAVHPLDVVSALLAGDSSGRAVGTLHAEYRADPAALHALLRPWSRAAGAQARETDLLSRLCGMDILAALLTGPRPAFRCPHAAEPHAHLRTGPQLASCVDFYRASCTHVPPRALGGSGEEPEPEPDADPERFGLYLALLDEACDALYAVTPLSLLSVGCPSASAPGPGRRGRGGLSVLCRAVRLLTAVGAVDPVFVRCDHRPYWI